MTLRSIYDNTKLFLVRYCSYCTVFLLLLLFARLYELVFDSIAHGYPVLFLKVILLALLKDLAFFLQASFFMLPLFFIVYWFSRSAARVFFIILSTLLVIIQVALAKYFITTLVPLGSDFWVYSWADIRQTVGAAGGVGWDFIFLCILVTAGAIYLFKKVNGLRVDFITAAIFTILFVSAGISNASGIADKMKVGQEHSNDLSTNKSYFFFNSTYNYFFPGPKEMDIYSDAYYTYLTGRSMGDSTASATAMVPQRDTLNNGSSASATAAYTLTYPDENNLPFFHTVDTARDVLSPFFNKQADPPNIVIVLVEGLGRAFTNKNAYLGNFTPFIDSLSSASLYWENFLSEGGRTFAVLPSLLGSLPFGKNGFNELGEGMPKHFSLLNVLKYNGYITSFYYGGNAHFDNMDVFMRKNAVNSINDEKTFPSKYSRQPASSSGFSWGFGDKELFRRFLETKDVNGGPYLSVLLTVSTHSPFLINEQNTYLQRVEQRMQELSFDEARKSEARNYKYQYASILYMDDAVRGFINAYKTRKDFNNTVFIITGDHRMPEIPMSTKIDRYHVPLIIYSPLLKRTATFRSVSTHFDITPTLLNWLHHTYNASIPSMAHWMGTGIDTSYAFRNTHHYPLMQTKNEVSDFILNEYMLNSTDLFRLEADMGLSPITNDNMKQVINSEFERFKQKNAKFIAGAALEPDSLLRKFGAK